MAAVNPEDSEGKGLSRTSITIPEDVLEMARAPMRRRYVRNFSDYVTRLIVEDVERGKLNDPVEVSP